MDMPDPTATPGTATDTDTSIELVLPARTDMAATLRVVVASLGADVGFTLDEIDDVRLAVNEVFASGVDDDGVSRFAASFQPGDGTLAITMRVLGSTPLQLDQLATTILESVVHELDIDEQSVKIVKRAREATT